MFNAKGMVQFGEATYRIAEVSRGNYQAIRVSDNVRMGTFETLPVLRVKTEAIGESLLLAIAHSAFMQGKTRRSPSTMVDECARELAARVEARSAVPAATPPPLSPWTSPFAPATWERVWRGMFPLLPPDKCAIA
jgi:hypothetical protein